MRARDHRFDGKFFVGVKTTGIYCRPICPAKPKRENVEFFTNQREAEQAGYRPCLRCRPESAPSSPAWAGKSAVVSRALRLIPETGRLDEDEFAAKFGLSARHLRRLFLEEVGKTPRQIFAEQRLNLARQLLVETRLPMAELAFAAGFGSVRRFNDAFARRFKKSPSQIRRSPIGEEGLRVSLPYRPPFDFGGLLRSYRAHRMGELEWFTASSMHRIVEVNRKIGEVTITDDPDRARLLVEIDLPDPAALPLVLARVRALFDLGADPLLVMSTLESDPGLKKILGRHPGLRLPSGWDPFELGIATILGQLVSVDRGRALVADLMRLLGREVSWKGRRVHLFPSPEKIASADLAGLKTTGARKRTLRAFARAVAEGEISLEPTQDVEEFSRRVQRIPGIGAWTASYMALKCLRDADAFPGTDLVLARALKLHPPQVVGRMSPWRGYCAALFWREYTGKI